MRLRALAKINLGLDVVGKRDDGYHEVRMIMQTIQMYDVLEIEKKKEPGIVLTTNIPYVPTDERNLVYKAAKMLMDEFDIKEGLTMNLEKFIPVAAGMAGGSSDAAAAFVGVNRLFGLGLSEEELMKRMDIHRRDRKSLTRCRKEKPRKIHRTIRVRRNVTEIRVFGALWGRRIGGQREKNRFFDKWW